MVKNKKRSKEEIEYIIKEAKANLAIEDMYVEKYEEDIARKYLRGELTEEEVLKILSEEKDGQ
ncbi:hypothetical protein [Clostridium polynesiense]|uniref:hypothetical protein n=1 Tax=Clostridium polynesiense TaxID=1325933 RepID=UPI00058B1619|nr:hypothetical protein [Clostridium polynesiense]